MTEAAPGIVAWHGSLEDFNVPDLSMTGQGATAGRFAMSNDQLPRAFYLHSTKEHAEVYGTPIPFEIIGKVKRYDGVAELDVWANDLGYPDAQTMLDDYYDGNLYEAMNMDTDLLDKLEQAHQEGYRAIAVDFGTLRYKRGDRKVPAGIFYVVSDPAQLRRIPS